MIDIIIPTIKKIEEIKKLVIDIKKTTDSENIIIPTCKDGSAAYNRNYGLNKAKNDIIIMLDDDITGFYDGWDFDLIKLLKENVIVVSARLFNPDGTPGTMVGADYNLDKEVIELQSRRVPTACIVFRNDGIRFDENYIGSGFEDDDFMNQLGIKYPKGKVLISNKCQLIHLNEKKNQTGDNWIKNKKYYLEKWKEEKDRWGENG